MTVDRDRNPESQSYFLIQRIMIKIDDYDQDHDPRLFDIISDSKPKD
jgi:hypothetical protein